jgi:hypothetical protein
MTEVAVSLGRVGACVDVQKYLGILGEQNNERTVGKLLVTAGDSRGLVRGERRICVWGQVGLQGVDGQAQRIDR